MSFFPDGYVKQMQLPVKCGNQKLTSKCCVCLAFPHPHQKRRSGWRKKKCGRDVYRVDVCLEDTVRVFTLFWVNDELAMRRWPTSSVLDA